MYTTERPQQGLTGGRLHEPKIPPPHFVKLKKEFHEVEKLRAPSQLAS
jgi:hypothetical protein